MRLNKQYRRIKKTLLNYTSCVILYSEVEDTKMTNKKHRAEVIETYPNEGKAAVRFSFNGHDRVECVSLYMNVACDQLKVGMKGWATYHMTPNCGIWGFQPFKKAVAA